MNTTTNNYELLNNLSVEYNDFAFDSETSNVGNLSDFGFWLKWEKNILINGGCPEEFIEKNYTVDTINIHEFILKHSNVELEQIEETLEEKIKRLDKSIKEDRKNRLKNRINYVNYK